ncbi:MAG: branched-chain amino acid ABC transporter permease [Pseudomonadota bacterium]
MRDNRAYIIFGVLLLGMVALGFLGDRFLLYVTMRILILAIFALGYDLLFGRTGLLSFGHGAFFAGGAYGTALCYLHLAKDPLVCLLAGLLLATALALIIGFFCVRHTEIYFAMLTLAFGMMVFSLIWNLREITGGDDGLVGISRGMINLGLVQIPIRKEGQFYFLVLGLFTLVLWFVHRVRSSPFGLILGGIRENARRTEFAGANIKHHRLAAFVMSGTLAGLAGGLSVLLESNAGPFSAHWSHSSEPVLVCLIGGINTLAGPLVGSFIFVALKEVVVRFTPYWMLWFGVVLLVILLGFRGGVVGTIAAKLGRKTKEVAS